jgi:ligand-binding sensor domain-containing protein
MKQNIFIILGILFSLLCLAQEPQYFRKDYTSKQDLYSKFDNYTTEDGLVSEDVKLILQDKQGYMWFGTSEGLSKFDGYEFTNYQNNPKDTSSISNNFITAIEEDINGDLWIGTKNGLNKLNRTHGTFQRFYAETGETSSLQSSYISELLSDSSGVLWIDTYEGYLHKFNLVDSTLKYYKHPSSEIDIYFVHRLFKDGNNIWICYRNKTQIFNIKEEKFELFEDREIQLLNNDVRLEFSSFSSAIKDELGNYYFGCVHYKTIIYEPQKQTLKTLPFGSVYCMLKGTNNQIWLGGYTLGLVQYDIKTNKFTQYRHNDDNPYSILDRRVWDILEDNSGNIWIATPSGVSKLSPQKQFFQHIRHISNVKASIIENDVQDVIQTKDSNIWIATSNGISVLNKNKKNIETHQHDPKNIEGLLNDKIKCLYQDKEETIWIGGWTGQGMDFIKKGQKIFKHYSISKKINGYDWYVDFAEANDELFVGTFGPLSLTKFDRSHFELYDSFNKIGLNTKTDISIIQSFKNYLFSINFTFSNLNKNKNGAFSDPEISENYFKANSDCIQVIDMDQIEKPNGYEIINGNLFAYTNFNLWIFDTINETFHKNLSKDQEINCIEKAKETDRIWIANENKLKKIQLGLHARELKSITLPAEITDLYSFGDTIYIGTQKGLYFAPESSLQEYNDLTQVKGFESIKINEIMINLYGLIIISSDNGLYILNQDKTIKEHLTPENSELSNGIIHDLFIDNYQNFWIGTQEGLNLYNEENGDIQSWFHNEMDPNSLSGNTIYSITERDDGLYLGTNCGYTIFNLESNSFIRKVSADEKSVQTGLITCLLSDFKDNIWIGNGSNGYSIDYLNTKTNTIKHYHDFPYDSASYKGKDANFIFEDSQNNIWIGTDKGLNKFDRHTETFKLFSKKNGMPTSEIMAMEEDDNGNYWLGSKEGLIKFNEEANSFKQFNTKDGISSNTFSQKAAAKLYSEELVFGSKKGLTVFHPDSIKPFTKPTTFQLTRLFIYDSLAYDDLSELKSIELNDNENNFTIGFSALDFIYPEKQHYQYILEGYDKKWITADYTQRKAKYTDLPYGTYTFLLKASNHDGYWSDEIKKLELSILPPWYQTKIAYAFYLLVFLGFSFLFGTVRIRLVKKRNKELEAEIEKRTEEILQKNEEINQQEISEIIKEHHIQNMKERFSGQEQERKRISRELHDGIAGNLTGIKLFLENLDQEFKGSKRDMLIKDIDRLYNEVRNISHDLLPPEFQDTSIREVLQFYIE